MMILLAATALEKMKETDLMVWGKFALIILGFIVAVLILKKLADVNKYLMFAVLVVGGSIVLINWSYNRTEPKFLTPVIDAIAPFLPNGKGLEPPKLDPENPNKPVRKK